MTTMFVRHKVANYGAWRKSYDEFHSAQKTAGVKAQAVYQAVDDPNDVTITHDFADLKSARAFAESAELKKAMQGAGVVGAPTVWFAHKA